MSQDTNKTGDYAHVELTKEELIDQLIAFSVLQLVMKETHPGNNAPPEFDVFDKMRKRTYATLRLKFSKEEILQMLRAGESNYKLNEWLGNMGLAMAMMNSYISQLREKHDAAGMTVEESRKATTAEMLDYVSKNVEYEGSFVEALDVMKKQGKAISEILTEIDEELGDGSSTSTSAASLIDQLMTGLAGGVVPSIKEPPPEVAKMLQALKDSLPPGVEVKAHVVPMTDQLKDLLGNGNGDSDILKKLFGNSDSNTQLPKKQRGVSGEVDDFLQS